MEAIGLLRDLESDDQYTLGLALGLEGAILVDMGRFKEAIPMLMEAHEIFDSIAGFGRRTEVVLESKLECIASIAKAHEALSMDEQATFWRSRLDLIRDELVNEQNQTEP